MAGTFLATDIFLFYVFWELMLIPMYLLIGVWGSQERIYAAVKFFLFTFARQHADARRDLLGLHGAPGAVRRVHRRDPELLPRRLSRAVPLLGPQRRRARFLGLHDRLRGEGAALPAAHLAARRSRAGADGRHHHPGGGAAQDGNLRAPALRHSDRARRLPEIPTGPHQARADRNPLRRAGSRTSRPTSKSSSPTRR